MAEESTDLPVTPEITKANEGNSRRNSMGKANSSNSREKVLPHYLRASTGSCHDFCKYGRKHAFEAKERRPLRKRITKPAADNQSSTVTVMVPERKKTPMVKPKSSPTSNIPEIIKREVSMKSAYGENLNASSDGKGSVKSEFQSGMKKTSATKLRPSSNSKPIRSESPKSKRQEPSSIAQKVDVSSKRASSISKEINASSKHAASSKLKSSVHKQLSSPDHLGGLSGRRNSDINPRNKVAVKKSLASPRLSLSSPRLSLASPRASLSHKPSIAIVASLNSGKHKSSKVVSPLKNQGKIKKAETEQSKNKLKEANNELKQANNDLIHEKTLYVIKMETENKSLESTQNESCVIESSPPPSSSLPKSLPTSPSSSLHNVEDEEQSEFTESGAEDDSLSESEYEYVEREENLGGEGQVRPRKDGMVHSEDKDLPVVKLHFRRGKIIDIQSESNNPRRLKFKRGRLLGENRNLRADGRRSFKKRVDGEMNDSKPDSEKVVLRHQDVQGKKDSQTLFNNVIEQTASKLVESRKSKVKALVGAFETVISLQETKPSANIVT